MVIISHSATAKPRFSFPVLEKVHPKPATEGKAKQPVKMEPKQVNPEISGHDSKQVNPESAENDPKQVNPESAETEVKQANPETSDDDPSVDEDIQQDVRERNPRAVRNISLYKLLKSGKKYSYFLITSILLFSFKNVRLTVCYLIFTRS